MFRLDAESFAFAFSRDDRALHGHNHDHNCSFTCVKYVKQNAKQIAEKGLGTSTNIVCRFFFYVYACARSRGGAVERVVRLRRRGKELVKKPYVASTNVHNEFGRVRVERHTPFRGSITDVGQCAVRCNLDFQFMPRAPVLAVDGGSAEKPDDGGIDDKPADE